MAEEPASPGPALDDCRDAVLSGSYNLNQLETLPASLLVQLLQLSVHDKAEAVQQRATALEEIRAILDARYLIDPPLSQDRVGDSMYQRVSAVSAKWEPRDVTHQLVPHTDYVAAQQKELVYSKANKAFKLTTHGRSDSDYVDISVVLSSALLLYRVCCLFPAVVEVAGPAGYESVWLTELQHRDTAEAVGFRDWKGAGQVLLSRLDGPPGFAADVLELLDLLCDEHCPHPYDGTVAGSVA